MSFLVKPKSSAREKISLFGHFLSAFGSTVNHLRIKADAIDRSLSGVRVLPYNWSIRYCRCFLYSLFDICFIVTSGYLGKMEFSRF